MRDFIVITLVVIIGFAMAFIRPALGQQIDGMRMLMTTSTMLDTVSKIVYGLEGIKIPSHEFFYIDEEDEPANCAYKITSGDTYENHKEYMKNAERRMPKNMLTPEYSTSRVVYYDLTSDQEFLGRLNRNITSNGYPPVDSVKIHIFHLNQKSVYGMAICFSLVNRSINE